MELISIKDAIEKYSLTKSTLRMCIYRNQILTKNDLIIEDSLIKHISEKKIKNFHNEEWVEIPFFSKYMASNYGRIKTLSYKGGNFEGLVNPSVDGGYLKSVFINDSGLKKTMRIHRLICLAFNYNENWETLEVNHKDGKKLNNVPSNLEWCTRSENIEHCIKNNLQRVLKGEEIGNSILTEKQVLEIRKRFKPRVCGREMLSKEFGVQPSTIKNIILRKTWKHI